MISVIQRVSQARVEVAGATIGEIGRGLLVLVCAERGDSEVQAGKLLGKLLKLRIFSDEAFTAEAQKTQRGAEEERIEPFCSLRCSAVSAPLR